MTDVKDLTEMKIEYELNDLYIQRNLPDTLVITKEQAEIVFKPVGYYREDLVHEYKKDGRIIADSRFEDDDIANPTAFNLWERDFLALRKTTIFNEIGTFFLDSFTTWIRALGWNIAKANGKKDGLLSQPDWQIVKNNAINYISLCLSLPCDFIMTGHTHLIHDQVEGKTLVRFNSIPSLQLNLPVLFDEIYVMENKEGAKGTERFLVTQNTGRYEARTRMGAGVFELREKPDITALLRKAGKIM